MRTALISGLVLPLLLAGSAAIAAPHGRADFVKDYDLDGDGVVSEAEFKTERDRRFKDTDANRDGVLSEAEYVSEYERRLDKQLKATKERQMKQAHGRFGALDTDANKRMSVEEYVASGWRMYGRQDADLDGTVTLKEGDEDNSAAASAPAPAPAVAQNAGAPR